eukprot:Sdes_comp11601_c0_seq2m2788
MIYPVFHRLWVFFFFFCRDAARFEVCGHKWVDISEHDFGVAFLNDSKYGFSCFDNVLGCSLLRSSKSPDQDADMGGHTFRYALFPHSSCLQKAGVIQYAYEFNSPIQSKLFSPKIH